MELSFFKELWELARTAGPFATLLLLLLLFDERKDRKAAQQQNFDLATSGLKALHGVESTISALREAITKRRQS